MLSQLFHQRYQEFFHLLEQLQSTSTQLDKAKLKQSLHTAQQFFQQQIVTLDPQDLSPQEESKIRSYQTEISKQLQLVGMDVIFLQAARLQATAASRQMQLADRIQTLIRYCNAILELA